MPSINNNSSAIQFILFLNLISFIFGQNCQPGTYIDELAPSSSCIVCPTGKYSDSLNAVNCTDCNAGYYLNYTGGNSSLDCLSCPYGLLSLAGSSFCRNDCLLGSRRYSSNGPECYYCDAGSYGNYSDYFGYNYCYSCPSGQYSANEGSIECEKCEKGFVQPSRWGESSCEECAIGKYSNISGGSTCNKCSPGKYASNTGSAKCSECPSGKMQDGTGKAFCYICDDPDWCINSYECINGRKGHGCSSCISNYYLSDEVDGEVCSKCPNGGEWMILLFIFLGLFIGYISFSISNPKEIDEYYKKTEEEILTIKNEMRAEDQFLSLINITIAHLQISSICLTINLKYPNFFINFINWIEIIINFKFTVGMAGPECSLGSISFLQRWIVSVLGPFIYISPLLFITLYKRSMCQIFNCQDRYHFILVSMPIAGFTAILSLFWDFLSYVMLYFIIVFLLIKYYFEVYRDQTLLFQDSRFEGKMTKEEREKDYVLIKIQKRALIAFILLVNAMYIFEMKTSISALRCKKENHINHDIVQLNPFKKDKNDNPFVMIDAPNYYCSHGNGGENKSGLEYKVIFIFACVVIFFNLFGINIGIFMVANKSKSVAKRLKLDLRDGCLFWIGITNVFKLFAVISILIPATPSKQNGCLLFLSSLMTFLVYKIKPHSEDINKAVSNNIAELVFYLNQVLLLLIQRFLILNWLSSFVSAILFLIVFILGCLWACYLNSARRKQSVVPNLLFVIWQFMLCGNYTEIGETLIYKKLYPEQTFDDYPSNEHKEKKEDDEDEDENKAVELVPVVTSWNDETVKRNDKSSGGGGGGGGDIPLEKSGSQRKSQQQDSNLRASIDIYRNKSVVNKRSSSSKQDLGDDDVVMDDLTRI